MAGDGRYHIFLNKKGYVLIDESYAVQPQRPFNPRFSTGDPSLGDLSFWQFFAQEDFSGGVGQEVFDDVRRCLSAVGWNMRSREAKIAGPWERMVAATNGGVDHTLSISDGLHDSVHPKVLWFNGSIYIVFPHRTTGDISGAGGSTPGLAAFTRTQVQDEDSAGRGKPEIFFVNAYDALIMRRTDETTDVSDGEHMVLVHGTSLVVKDEAWSTEVTVTLPEEGYAIGQFGNDRVLVAMRDTFTFSGATTAYRLALSVVQFNSNGWGVAKQGATMYSDLRGFVVNSIQTDSNGTAHIIVSSGSSREDLATSRIVRVIAQDITSGSAAISDVSEPMLGFIPCNLFSMNGAVYMLGYFMENKDEGRKALVKYPNTLLWKSDLLVRQDMIAGQNLFTYANSGVMSFPVFKGSDACIFAADSADSPSDIVLFELGLDEKVRTLSRIPGAAVGSQADVGAPHGPRGCALFMVNASLYYANVTTRDADIYRDLKQGESAAPLVTTRRGNITQAGDVILRSSAFGGNTSLIDKSLFAVGLKLTAAIPDDAKLRVYVNGALFGEVIKADGLNVTVVPSAEFTARAFSIEIRYDTGIPWKGGISALLIKYMPTQFKKLAWGFALRATKSLKLLNGHFDEREPEQIVSDLKDVWASNVPQEFIDQDGKTYSVIMTEFKARMPLAADKAKDREYLVSLELLEV